MSTANYPKGIVAFYLIRCKTIYIKRIFTTKDSDKRKLNICINEIKDNIHIEQKARKKRDKYNNGIIELVKDVRKSYLNGDKVWSVGMYCVVATTKDCRYTDFVSGDSGEDCKGIVKSLRQIVKMYFGIESEECDVFDETGTRCIIKFKEKESD